MLIEVKARVTRTIDAKTRRRTETFIIDREFFAQAEYAVTAFLQEDAGVENMEILSLRQSQIKEIASQFTGEYPFLATLRDTWVENDGTEKQLKYKVLLWADTPSKAMGSILQLAKQGYDLQVEGIKQVDYEYLTEDTEEDSHEQED